MADPLLILRSTVLQDVSAPPIVFFDSYGASVDSLASCDIIGLSGSLFSKDVDTNYKSKRGTGSFYSLEAVVFLVLHREATYTEYLQEARAQNVPVVSLVDKKELLDYLSTPGADCPYVDLSSPPVPNAVFDAAPAAVPEAATPEKPSRKHAALADKKKRPHAASKPSKPPAHIPIVLPDGTRAIKIRCYEDYFHSGRDFGFVAEYARQTIKELDELAKDGEQRSKTSASLMEQISAMRSGIAPMALSPEPPRKSHRVLPVIIVPNAPSSLISIYNIKDFLEHGTWVPPVEAKQKAGERLTRVHIINKHSGKEYLALDNPEQILLDASDWDQLAAVFLVGAAWQFKGWRWDQPVELFQHAKGFYVHFDDLKLEGPVGTWKIHRLPLSRSRRHLDSTVAMDFWKHVHH